MHHPGNGDSEAPRGRGGGTKEIYGIVQCAAG